MKLELNENEAKMANSFIREHKKSCCHGKPFSALGMQFTYIVTPGGLGSMIAIKCNACGEVEEITDMENW